MEMSPLYLPAILFVGAIIMLAALLNRYRRCPSDKILVIFGTRGTNGSAKCITVAVPRFGPSFRTMPT